MEDTDKIVQTMTGMVYEKAKEIYSENLVAHGINPRNYDVMDHPDGHGKITGT